NATGRVTFIGGSTAGFIGKSLEALRIVFRVKGSGVGSLTFVDGAITASDGSGTNLLTSMKGVQFTITGKNETATVPLPPTAGTIAVPPPPVQITRPAAPAEVIPAGPPLTVSLYPIPGVWSNVSDNFLVSWTLPPDVSAVATAVNKEPGFAPQTSEGLFNNKYFKPLGNGIWYLHVRFRNSLGWGPTTHYKIAIDTIPPAPFNIRMDQSTSTDTPNPTIRFGTSDQPSGIDYYSVLIDAANPIRATGTSLTLPLQIPGKHTLIVRARDKAGNITERMLPFEILPIVSPTISPINGSTFLGEGPLQVSGGSLAGTKLYLSVKNQAGEIVEQAEVAPDSAGDWAKSIDLPRQTGSYYVEAVSQDKRGALSLPVRADFEVRIRPLFVWGGLEITSNEFVIFLILLLAGGFFAGYYTQKLAKDQRGRRTIIAQRDISVVFNMLKKDIDKMLEEGYKGGPISEAKAKEMEFYLKRMKDNLDKTKRYMSENVEEIKG
ncbi:MAG: hypothetical protein Q7S36_02310, partial [Candidatus Liptonbacteria bacterium]|nr:hypothetical protein [Candidatus Liptonbacteria bacterium]